MSTNTDIVLEIKDLLRFVLRKLDRGEYSEAETDVALQRIRLIYNNHPSELVTAIDEVQEEIRRHSKADR